MRVLFHKTTGRVIEAQSGGDQSGLAVLLANAQAAGIAPAACEARIVPDDEFHQLLAAQAEAERTYADRRRAEYPPLADQLDALWKGGEAAEAMRQRVLAVKAKHPKAEG